MVRRALVENIRHSLWLALALVGCATYEGSTSSFDSSSAGSSGVAGSRAGAPSSAGTGGSSVVGGAGQQTVDDGGSAAGPETSDGGAGSGGAGASAGSQGGAQAGRAGSGGSGGKAGSSGGASSSGAGSAGTGGTPGNAGTGGTAGSASAGSAGTGGSAGGTVHLLSQGKASSADSEQTSKGNLAALGNDGSATTRWCANDGAANHYWQVDLGTSHSLSKLEIVWEKAAVYKFKVEGSSDGNTWAQFLDQTNSSNGASDQTYTLSSAPSARWVRITVTGLANSTTWASFFELSVSGY